MSMGRRRIRGWDEENAFTSWRHLCCYLQRAGTRDKVKRRARRRERHEARQEARDGRQP